MYFEIDWTKQKSRKDTNSYMLFDRFLILSGNWSKTLRNPMYFDSKKTQTSIHFGRFLISAGNWSNIQKSYVFGNELSKTENSEKTRTAIYFGRFLIFVGNRSKTLRNSICFEMDWIKQKIPKGYTILTYFAFRLQIDPQH